MRRYCSNSCRQRAYRLRVAYGRRVTIVPTGDFPSTVDSFVGRREELRTLTRLIGKHRLLTLIGPAGGGKTRLARELVTRLRRGYSDNVLWIDLSVVEENAVVVRAVAAALGVPNQSGDDLVDILTTTLASTAMLLVLDGCEHLIEGVAELVDRLMRRCPAIRVIATSRESLVLKGECVHLVNELSLPSEEFHHTKASVLRTEAVQLFVDRAAATTRDFALTDENVSAVAALCRQLDGLPLAIELAARHVRWLPVTEIIARLNDHLLAPAVAQRTTDRRHHSLDAAIGWSYELLKPDEQATWRRLAVLRGVFGLDAAAAVCGKLSLAETSELLAKLEAKSLLVAVHGGGAKPIFRQLESIRLFGQRRLGAGVEFRATMERLVAWIFDLLDSSVDRAYVMFTVLKRFNDNWITIAAAVEHAADTRDPRYPPLAFLLSAYWLNQGHTAEAERLASAALDTDPPDRYRSLLLGVMSYRARAQRDYAESLRLAEEAIAIERRLEGPARLARALLAAAVAEGELGHVVAALGYFDECIAVLRTLDQPQALSLAISSKAWTALSAGDVGLAAQTIEASLEVLRGLEPSLAESQALYTAGAIALLEGDVEGAEGYFIDSVRAAGKAPSPVARGAEGMALVAVANVEPERAVRLIEAALGIRLSIRETGGPPYWQALVNQALKSAVEQLTAAQVRAARAAACRLDLDQVIELAGTRAPQGQVDMSTDRQLTAREREIAALVAHGHTNVQIAKRLGISTATVATHLGRVRAKLKVRSRTQLAARIIQELS